MKQYEEEFKRQSVKHVLQTGKAVAQVARELGISVNTLYGWVKKYKQEPKVIQQRTFRSEDKKTNEMERRIRDLEEENAILKKGDALLRERPSVKFKFIHRHRFTYRVEKMCQVLHVSRSGYYKWKHQTKSPKQIQREQITKEIHRIFLESRCLYGSPKVTSILRQKGKQISQKTVARIMKKQGLQSRTVKKYKATTNSKHSYPIQENVLNRQFKVKKPNQVWVADITYVSTKEGWLYVASLMDLYSRKIVGWHADRTMTKELVLKALQQAYFRQKPEGSVLHHSDRGSQYASHDYQKQLEQYGMQCSMSRKGNCYDNACIESFHGVLKKELIYQQQYTTRAQAQQDIWEYIEIFYNRKRIHSANGYLSPIEKERMYALAAA
ncbi:IS3 family transposase (plasmid) [Bacillus tropicus]|nr:MULTISPECIES: IS3 family transposase [Bacillus cereus group]QDF27038.1 IS3 family transposase [Bacillus tropicus]QDF27457.1 IS3 family transposase [Bacillus tropicus]QUG98870.1 IS3 family transposase [Bacillus tropicus]QUG99345.1 IS3 family transposase [Bacillus tropicus]